MGAPSTRLAVAQGVAVLLFGVAHFGLTVMANSLAHGSPGESPLGLLNAASYALFGASGCVAALIGGVRPIVFGALAGVLCALVAVAVFGASRDPFGVAALLATGLVLGAIGGCCSLPMRRKRIRLR
jgi:hypothetical protein